MWPGGSDTVSGDLFRGVSADAPFSGSEEMKQVLERERKTNRRKRRGEKKGNRCCWRSHTHSSLASLFPSHFSHASESSYRICDVTKGHRYLADGDAPSARCSFHPLTAPRSRLVSGTIARKMWKFPRCIIWSNRLKL